MKTGLIYKVTNNLNKKCYVGQTIKTAKTRWNEHISAAKRDEGYLLGRALRKYKTENFTWEVIVDKIPDYFLDSFERYWIYFYDAYTIGYNCDAGGPGRSQWTPTEFTKKLWSKQRKGAIPWNKGKETPATVRKKQSEAAKGRTPTNLSQLHELSKKRVGDKHQNFKPANIYNYKTNKILAINISITKWCRENGHSQGNMSNTARGLVKQCKGLYAKYI